ncbi:DUF5590 domain-containing protein [Ornithinibacillus xuwenensis]|uniref:DUF5590 domain-containing protein n=1 Tax=Ornithinibacillus xuwenensis TaxID=3144668 RepID=A0ABU9XEU0_9BACI
MNNRRLNFPSWTKWVVLGVLLLMVAIIAFITFLYVDIQNSKTEGYFSAEKRVLDETSITSIRNTIRFHGDEAYHVVYGETEKNKEQIVFVPNDKKVDLTIVDQEDILSSDTIESDWKKNCSGCELKNIVPAIIKDNVLWEITYIDEANRYVIDYVSMYDGTQYEEFRFKKMFE